MPNFPPTPVYPDSLDSDYTLFKVYNSSQATLSADNDVYSEEISINPTEGGEVWPDNGFANISGELIYYDAVSKNSSGKVNKLRRVLRGLNGTSSFNPQGASIRGTVVAEHHNQLTLATQKIQNFVGVNNSTDESTVDYRIREMASQPAIFDDYATPDVQFNYSILDQDPNRGTLVSYSVGVVGRYDSLLVSFGDGSTTTTGEGTHQYSVNAVIDPVVTVTSGDSELTQTPIQRSQSHEPDVPTPFRPFTVPIPVAPSFPCVVFPSTTFPEVDILFPPIVMPSINLCCSNISSFSISLSIGFPSTILSIAPISFMPFPSIPLVSIAPFPSAPVISIGPFPSTVGITLSVAIPSVTFGPFPSVPLISFAPFPAAPVISFAQFPSLPLISFAVPSFPMISIGPFPSVPLISFGPFPSLPVISFGPFPSLPVISFGPFPSLPSINFGTPPTVSVNWGTPPSTNCTCTVVCPSQAVAAYGMAAYEPVLGDVEMQYDVSGLPSVISITAPERPIRIEHNIPTTISVETPIFRDITIIGPRDPIPSEIRIVAPNRDELPTVISFEMPSSLSFHAVGVPSKIFVQFPDEMPKISFDRNTLPDIRVVGIPSTIRVTHDIPSFIDVRFPENISIPVVVDPVEVKINLTFDKIASGGTDGLECFALVPCKR